MLKKSDLLMFWINFHFVLSNLMMFVCVSSLQIFCITVNLEWLEKKSWTMCRQLSQS